MSDHESADDQPTQILSDGLPVAPGHEHVPPSIVPRSAPDAYGELPPLEPVRGSGALTVAVLVGAGVLVVLLISVIGALL